MSRLRLLCLVAPLLGACSLVNAPAEIDPGTGGTGGATGGTGGTGGATGGAGGTGGTTMSIPCGDGSLDAGEQCDDGDVDPGDGCSDACTIESGWECTGEPGKTSSCKLLCGNGKLDPNEECDDEGEKDMNPPFGNQDVCSDQCKLQEFDIESGDDSSGVVHELPSVGYRRDADVPSFVVLWHAANDGKILSKEYRFDGSLKKATPVDMATSPAPDAGGEVMCTASTNVSVIGWHDMGDGKVYTRNIAQDGMLFDAAGITYPSPAQPFLSCAASSADGFAVVTMAKGSGQLFDVWAQPFNASGVAVGTPIDVGDAAAPNQTAVWGIQTGYLVAWVADPANNGNIAAQQIKETGEPEPGFIFQISDAADVAPREPVGVRTGMASQFAVAYTRDSAPDGNGMTHREVVLRLFQSPGSAGAPIPVATGTTAQREPVIGVDRMTNKIVVVWTALANGGENVFYRVYSQMGLPLTDELVANEVLTGKQTKPAVVVDPPTGDTVILWDNFVPNSVKPHKVSAKIFKGLLK